MDPSLRIVPSIDEARHGPTELDALEDDLRSAGWNAVLEEPDGVRGDLLPLVPIAIFIAQHVGDAALDTLAGLLRTYLHRRPRHHGRDIEEVPIYDRYGRVMRVVRRVRVGTDVDCSRE